MADQKTWYKELKGDYLPKMLYEIRDGRIIKIDIAREPGLGDYKS